MISFPYVKADAFTGGASLGNPAACLFTGDERLSDAAKLDVGRRHKGFVCEVVFCQNSTTADCALSYVSSECEVDFCGHGTVAAMYTLLRARPDLARKPEITAETARKGTITVYNCLREEDAVYIAAPKAVALPAPADPAAVCDALGLAPEALDEDLPIRLIDAGLRTLLVPLARLADEVALLPDEARLRAFCVQRGVDIVLPFCREVSDPANAAHSRVFAPKFGYLEDPATGSGNSALGNYLLGAGLWDGSPIALEQGGRDRVFNLVRLRTRDGAVLFGGRATVQIEGRYFLPETADYAPERSDSHE